MFDRYLASLLAVWWSRLDLAIRDINAELMNLPENENVADALGELQGIHLDWSIMYYTLTGQSIRASIDAGIDGCEREEAPRT